MNFDSILSWFVEKWISTELTPILPSCTMSQSAVNSGQTIVLIFWVVSQLSQRYFVQLAAYVRNQLNSCEKQPKVVSSDVHFCHVTVAMSLFRFCQVTCIFTKNCLTLSLGGWRLVNAIRVTVFQVVRQILIRWHLSIFCQTTIHMLNAWVLECEHFWA